MDVWIIQNGEKSGPLPDFEVRSRIHAGELKGETMAWHEGLSEWRPLSAISLFSNEFERRQEQFRQEQEEQDEPPEESRPPPLPPATPAPAQHLIRRFWARWFDLYLYSGFWWIGMWTAGRDIGATLANPWVMLLQYVPWFAIETILLHHFGTTPGKWLLGIRVRNDDGSALTLAQATRRSLRVMFLGIGLGWSILALLCQMMAYFTTRRLGKPLWDLTGGHRLATTSLHPLRITGYVIGLFAALQLQMIVVAPYVTKYMKESFPALHEHLEKNPPWHLPDNRSR